MQIRDTSTIPLLATGTLVQQNINLISAETKKGNVHLAKLPLPST